MENDLTSKISFRENWNNIRNIMRVTWEIDPSHYGIAALVHLINAIHANLSLIITAVILNAIYAGKPASEIIGTALLLILAGFVLRMAASVLWNEVMAPKRENVARTFRLNRSAKYQNMDFSLINSPYVKKLSERIAKDNNWGAGIYNVFWSFDSLVYGVLNLLCSIVIAIPFFKRIFSAAHPWLWPGILLLFVLLAVFIHIRSKWEAAYNEELLMDWSDRVRKRGFNEETEKKMASFTWYWAMQAISGAYHHIKVIHLYDGYELMKHYTVDNEKKQDELVSWAPTLGKLAGRLEMTITGSRSFLTLTGFLVSAAYAIAGAFALGDVLKYAGCMTNVLDGIVGLQMQWKSLSLTARKHASTLEMLNISDEMYKGKLPVEKRRDHRYEIEFRNVSFRYPGNEQYALRHFSMRLRIGERLAIVGMNGSGKTTMIKLLCRLYDPEEGEILLNGVDIKKFSQTEYIRLFSVVFQDFQLLSLPLGQNVAASLEYDRALARECLEKAGLGERLDELPYGLDTYLYQDISDEGVEISGGEAQKIALARALYKDAPFVLLDEPTASLDPLSEYEVYSGFDAMVGAKTAIYISHRLSSCQFCDDIAVFHEGRLIQRGSHEELLRDEQGKYYELWNAQAQYYT